MKQETGNSPRVTERAKEAKAKKSDALKAALRENLRKRKAQARAKKAGASSAE